MTKQNGVDVWPNAAIWMRDELRSNLQGRSQEFVSERTKECVSSPAGPIPGQSTGWGLGQSPRNSKNMLKM